MLTDCACQRTDNQLFFNQGECCIAGSRVYVHEAVYDQFLEKVVASLPKVGAPTDKDTFYGPLVDKIQFERVMDYIEHGKKAAAEGKCTLASGGDRIGDKGFFIQPTVFTDVDPDCTIANEEIFGPVLSIMKRFSTVEEVLEMANAGEYGLGAGVACRDIGKALRVAQGLRAGTVYVNCYNVFDCAAPFGGFKQSGHGRELGAEGLDNYTETRTVIIPIDK